MNREEVIKGLKRVSDDIVNGYITEPDMACNTINYAIDLLKMQEPHLLGLDEIKMLGLMWLESRNGFVQPVICQNYEYGVDRSVEFIMVHGTICNSINTLGKLWRVWTSKPSDEQMEATPWN